MEVTGSEKKMKIMVNDVCAVYVLHFHSMKMTFAVLLAFTRFLNRKMNLQKYIENKAFLTG